MSAGFPPMTNALPEPAVFWKSWQRFWVSASMSWGNYPPKPETPITLASTCTVWAQADVIKYINSGVPIEDIGAGINTAMAGRVAILVNAVKPEGDIFMTGGVAKNIGVLETLEKLIGKRIKRTRKADPQIAGAIGAALLSMEKVNGREKI